MSQQNHKKTHTGLPVHVGIIMDGNGRWAVSRGLPRDAGHKKGADVFEAVVSHALERGIEHLTVYAFSTENFRRPQKEVDTIMDLMRKYLKDRVKKDKKEILVNFIGDTDNLPEDIRDSIYDIQTRNLEKDKSLVKMILNIAFNYGGRQDVLNAAKILASKYANGEITNLESFTEDDFSKLLYTKDQPEADLIIRTSGENRVSNFLIWQGAYAEYVFSPVLWPDFGPEDLDRILDIYLQRDRRLGGV